MDSPHQVVSDRADVSTGDLTLCQPVTSSLSEVFYPAALRNSYTTTLSSCVCQNFWG